MWFSASSKKKKKNWDEDGVSEKDRRIQKACQSHACAIQTCLASNGNSFEKCKRLVDAYQECALQVAKEFESK